MVVMKPDEDPVTLYGNSLILALLHCIRQAGSTKGSDDSDPRLPSDPTYEIHITFIIGPETLQKEYCHLARPSLGGGMVLNGIIPEK